MPAATKAVLEDLLRARRLQRDGPPLRGEDRRRTPLPSGIGTVDALLGGGFPRGELSEVHGPASSGRTGLVLSLFARTTRGGSLAALVDPDDRFDPASAAAAGIDLARLLWLRGVPGPHALPSAVSAVGTLAGSGLFEVVLLDLADAPGHDLRRLPGPTWIRLQRVVEESPTALLLVAAGHVAKSPGGASLALPSSRPIWSGPAGPGRLLTGLETEVRAGLHAPRRASFALRAFS
jgi:recombination protein RecA